jgi:hypothetical protein
MRAVTAVAGAAAAGIAGALGVRLARGRRVLHPDGRSFTGTLDVWGLGRTGSALIDRPGRYPVTVRISKGGGTRPGRPDVLGVALRVHGPAAGAKRDLLYSTAGRGRLLRHVPTPRRSFDTRYGSIQFYRTGSGARLYLVAEADPAAQGFGRTLESVCAAAAHGGALLLGVAGRDGRARHFGRVTFAAALPASADAALAFDPVRHATPDLHPSGTVHGLRGLSYPVAQRWRGARPAPADPAAVARTAAGG